ncbi:unnamed protein product [Cercopithifilaria johnstoni]|uniref:EGF-like domain-containing protein n=1 Tax=Cercopithifilaria johnstoni TaxID=2874296 RepID=A0A8J2MG11_9BILA|nr:unnamed protein product [Cercopithifilaria johnstoni]
MDIAFFLSFFFAGTSSSGIAYVGKVGQFCDPNPNNLPCTTPNTSCNNNICTCAPMYEEVNGECILRSSKTLASRCRISEECTGKGEYCNRSNGKCCCLSTHFVLEGKCKPVIYPGQSGCEDSRQCAKGYPGATCTSQNKCQCPKGFKAKAFSCFKSKRYAPQQKRSQLPSLNTYDQSNFIEEAKYNPFGIPIMHKISLLSLCPLQHVFIKEIGTCMTIRLPGESCQYSEQCAATDSAAFCQKLKCECAPGMKLNGNSCAFMEPKCALLGYVWVSEMTQCMQVLPPGANGCSHSIQCSTASDGAYCSRHKCTCPEKQVPIDGTCGEQCRANMIFSAIVGKCIPAIKPGGKCQYSSQCQMNDTEMICVRGFCRCSLGKVFTGDMCDERCPSGYVLGKNGICRQGCNSKQIEHNDECYDRMPIGQRCLVNLDCMGEFRCVNNICVCPSSMMIKEGLCRQKEARAMESCANGEICLGGSFCLDGICVCPAGNINLNEECVPSATVPPNSLCNSTAQCSGGSTCTANICQCPNFQQSVNGICELLPAVSMGNDCPTGNERCLGDSNCLFGKCECPLGTVRKSSKCILKQKVPIGSPCNSTQICLGMANCIDGICQCPIGMVLQDGKCHDFTLIGAGDGCVNGEFCGGGSICNKSICLCPIGTTNQNGICVAKEKISYEGTCINGETCSDDLLCIDGICQCPQGIFTSSGQCISTIDTHSLGKCSNSSQCAKNSYCNHQNGLCICKDGYQYHDQSCIPMFTRTLISPIKICITNADCTAGAKSGEIFMDGRCQMIFAEPGESCLSGETCISNYVCINGSCLCPDDEVSWDGNCVKEDIKIKKYITYEAKPNSPCSKGEFCVGGSFCNVMDGMCRCPADTIFQNGRCELTNVQSTFTLPSQQIFNRNKDIMRKPSNHSIININRVTLRMNRCESNDDCTGGAYCFNHRCICPFNMIMKGGICQRMFPISLNRIDKQCTGNHDCTIRNSECHKGICICLPGHRISGDTGCIPTATTFSNNHLQAIIPTEVIDMSNSITKTTTNEMIDSSLEVKSDETSLNSAIFTPLPLIDAGIERIPSSRQTEMIVNISGGVCNETTLCLFFSVCRSGICKCPLGTRISDTECKFIVDVTRLRQFEKLLRGGYSILAYATRSTLPIKSRTTNLLPVTTFRPISSVKVMTTPVNRIWSTEEVWPTIHPRIKPELLTSISSRCKTTQQCPPRSHCINGFCSCILGTTMSRSGFCIPINTESGPGMPCINGEKCTGFSKCIRGMCTCPPEQNNIVGNECAKTFRESAGVSLVFSYRGMQRTEVDQGENNDCTTDPTICRDGTYCLKGSCVCPTGHICTPNEIIVNTGEPCDENNIRMQCAGNSICTDGFCTCPSGERIINGICTPINSQR